MVSGSDELIQDVLLCGLSVASSLTLELCECLFQRALIGVDCAACMEVCDRGITCDRGDHPTGRMGCESGRDGESQSER